MKNGFLKQMFAEHICGKNWYNLRVFILIFYYSNCWEKGRLKRKTKCEKQNRQRLS